MNNSNPWSDPSKADVADAVQMAAFLEERSQAPDLQAVNRKLCAVIAARQGERLLEVGSGSGTLCRMLVPLLEPHGCIVGIDISPEMVAEARRYALAEGLGSAISFEIGQAEALQYPDTSFDVAFAARLLLHVTDPGQIISEMKRVVRPGGRVVVMDWDYGTLAVDHPDREITRRLLQWRCDHHGGNNWSGRQLWRLMHAAGLQDLSVFPCVAIAHTEKDALTQSLWRTTQAACEAGAVSTAEKQAWEQLLKYRIQAGTFFASIVYFIVSGMVVSP